MDWSFVSLHLVLAVFSISLLVLQKRPRATNVGWFCAIIALPVVGSIAFLFFRTRGGVTLRCSTCVLEIESNERLTTHERVLLKQGYSLPSQIVDYGIVVDGQYVEDIIDAIDRAKESVYIFTFIFGGKAADVVIEALRRAEKRQVYIYVLIDYVGSGCFKFWRKRVRRLKNLSFIHTYTNRSFRNVSRRLHTKIVLIDDREVWIGSHNIWDNAVNKRGTGSPTLNTSIKISGGVAPLVKQYIKQYIDAKESGKNLDVDGASKKKPVAGHTSTDVSSFLYKDWEVYNKKLDTTLMDALLQARNRCVIVSPYFAPKGDMLQTLNILISRNVQVEILCPQKINNIFTPLTDSYLSHMYTLGAKIYRSTGNFEHSKFFIIDDKMCLIGSYNMDWRSASTNLEVMCEVYSKKITEELIEIYEKKRARAVVWEVSVLPLTKRLLSNMQSALLGVF